MIDYKVESVIAINLRKLTVEDCAAIAAYDLICSDESLTDVVHDICWSQERSTRTYFGNFFRFVADMIEAPADSLIVAPDGTSAFVRIKDDCTMHIELDPDRRNATVMYTVYGRAIYGGSFGGMELVTILNE